VSNSNLHDGKYKVSVEMQDADGTAT